MRNTRFLLLLCCLALPSFVAGAQQDISFASLRARLSAPGAVALESGLVLEGLVISEPGNPNLENGTQSGYKKCYPTLSNRTAYLESPDGAYGFRLAFDHYTPEARKMLRYGRARIALDGATLRLDENGCYILENLPNGSVLDVKPGRREDIPVKEKALRELTAADIYTWVKIKNCEFVFKDGSYVNIYDRYGSWSGGTKAMGRMDSWQTLLCNDEAQALYALVNSRCQWRRRGNGVPQGTGTVEGVLVRSDLNRYGHVNAWQIRPLEEEDFQMEPAGASAFKTLVEWNWNDRDPLFHTDMGPQKRFTRAHKMPSDIGSGELYMDFTNSTYRTFECNNKTVTDEGRDKWGYVDFAAMEIRTQAKNWWNWSENCGSSVILKFSTEGIKGDRLWLAFSFGAGGNAASSTAFCPAYWGVEVSTDDVHISRVGIPDIEIHPQPWFDKTIDGVPYGTSMDCGLGLTEHLVVLPSSLLGQKEVYVRISPTRKTAYSLAEENSRNATLRPNLDHWTFTVFGTISVRYR